MLALTKRHATEVAVQARDDLLLEATDEGSKADDFLNIVQEIYIREENVDFFKAESRIVEIIDRYGQQEKRKISASYTKDREGFPMSTEAWESTKSASARPGTSRPSRPRSGQRSPGADLKRRKQETTAASAPPPPPPPPPSSAQAQETPQTSGGYKGKAGSKGHVKGASRRPAPTTAQPEPSYGYQHRDLPQSRGSRGQGPVRGHGRGRGSAPAASYQRQDRDTFSTEDRALFEAMKAQFKSK